MRCHSFSRLLERFKVRRADLLLIACVGQWLSVHAKLNVAARTCHALVVRLVAMHLERLVLVSLAG